MVFVCKHMLYCDILLNHPPENNLLNFVVDARRCDLEKLVKIILSLLQSLCAPLVEHNLVGNLVIQLYVLNYLVCAVDCALHLIALLTEDFHLVNDLPIQESLDEKR